jgi:hypothetical protein
VISLIRPAIGRTRCRGLPVQWDRELRELLPKISSYLGRQKPLTILEVHATMASAINQLGRGSINKVYRGRTLRVLVTPTPITFAERRAILQVLEQHGPVEVFKMTMVQLNEHYLA